MRGGCRVRSIAVRRKRKAVLTINVLTGGALPRLLSDIVRTLVHDQPDIQVQAEGLSVDEIVDYLQQDDTDVVIVGCEPKNIDADGRGILQRLRQTRVIAVTAHDCDAVLYRLTPVSHELGKLSAESLLDAIRGNGTEEEALD